jgi:hypothetical protein
MLFIEACKDKQKSRLFVLKLILNALKYGRKLPTPLIPVELFKNCSEITMIYQWVINRITTAYQYDINGFVNINYLIIKYVH